MNKVSFTDSRDASAIQQSQKLSKELKENKDVQQLFLHNNISLNQIDSHPYTIQRWFDSYKPCLKCKGLSNCMQKQKGYFDNIVDDGMLHVDKQACKYMKAWLKERKHLDNYLVSDLPQSLSSVSFEQIQLDEETNAYLLVLKEAMDLCENDQGMYLYGTMGSGKTYLSACACNYHARNNHKVAFIHYPTFVGRMVQQMSEGEYRSELAKLKYVHFLVIDDIGAENVTEWNRDAILLPLLNERYENHLPTWFTSNEDLKSLQEHFRYSTKMKEEQTKSMRIMERIKAMAKPVSLRTESRRNYQ